MPRLRTRRLPHSDSRSLYDLAARYGVSQAEAARFVPAVLSDEDDPARQDRVRRLAGEIARAAYGVEPDQIADCILVWSPYPPLE